MQDAHHHPIAAAAYDVAHRQQGDAAVQNATKLLDDSHTMRSPSYIGGKDDYTMEEPSDVFGRVQLPSVQRLKMEVDGKELDRSQSPSYEAASILAKLRRDGPAATGKTAEPYTGKAQPSPKEYHGWHPDASSTPRPRARLHPYPRRLTAPSSTQYRGIQLPWPIPGLPQDVRRNNVLLTPRRYLSSSPELHSSTRLTYTPKTYPAYGQPLQHGNEGYNGAFPGPLAYHQRSYNYQASSSPTQTGIEAKSILGQAMSTPVAYKSIETKPDLSSSLDNVSSWVTVRAELEKLLVPDDMHQHGVNGIDLDVFASMATQRLNTDELQGIRVLTSHFCATTSMWHSSAAGLGDIADTISSNVVALHLAGINASCYSSIPASTSQVPQDPPARRTKLVSRTLAPTSSADVGNTNARLGVHRIALPLDATCDSWSSWCNTVHEAGHAALGVADPNKRCTYVSCISWHGSQWITLSDISKILKFRLECINFRVLDIKQLKEGVYSALRTVRDADTCAVEQDSPLLQALNALGCLAMCRNQKIYRWHAVDHDKLFRNAHIKAISAARALTQPSLRMATAAVNKAATATTQSNREMSNPGMPALRGVHGKLMPMCLPVDVSW